MHIKTYCQQLLSAISSLFIRGLLTLLPITLTYAVFAFMFKLITSWLAPLNNLPIPFIDHIPHPEILTFILIVFLSGLFLQSIIAQSLLKLAEKIISYIPLVRAVYGGIKKLIHAFSPGDSTTFKQVVFLEFPRKGIHAIGFVTGDFPRIDIFTQETKKYYSVFVPKAPNPAYGFYLIVPQEEATHSSLTVKEAMTLVISGGIIVPEKKKQ